MSSIMPTIRTIQDMERYYYGSYGANLIKKADSPLISDTTGVYNAIYGAKVWSSLNQEANAFSVLPKKPWDKSGWRVITTRAATSGGGVGENSTLPDTIKPSFEEKSTKPKTVAHTFNASEVMSYLATVDDSLGNVMKVLREEMAKHHTEMINKMLLGDVDTVAGDSIESIDRVCSSRAEESGCLDAGDADIYGIDRSDSANSWADAYVDENDGTTRELTLSMIDSAFENIWTAGGMPKVIITGYDTLTKIQQLLQAQQRFATLSEKRASVGVEGVKSIEGYDVGFTVATYNNVPIIPSKDVTQDTISRMYFLDTDYLFFKTSKPTQYFESGMSKGDPFAINYLGDEGMYRTMGELICTRFNVQGKIRDLQ